MIKKIKIRNYKIFESFEIDANIHKNIIVGENGVGKSTLLEAISLVLSGSKSMVDKIGYHSMFNVNTIHNFFTNEKNIENLPEIHIELYLEDSSEPINEPLCGKNNLLNIESSGLSMRVVPDLDLYSKEIKEILSLDENIFPYEFYKLQFKTFSDTSFDSYSKRHKFRYEFIDSTKINSKVGLKKFVSNLFSQHATTEKKNKIRFKYRQQLDSFSEQLYEEFDLNTNDSYRIQASVEGNNHFDELITASKNKITIDQEGHGEQLLLGIESSMNFSDDKIKILLIEEPENHLSFINMLKLISLLQSTNQQLFISTHSNMIASRLELKNLHILSRDNSTNIQKISNVAARFFQKSPNTNLLDFILSKKAILVEGTAEYILLNKFYESQFNQSPEDNDISIISVNGLNFSHYLELACILEIDTLIITDNDRDYNQNIIEKYNKYCDIETISIKSDIDNNNYTFEACLYNFNKERFEESFKNSSMKNGLLSYMLDNKVEFAMRLLEKMENDNYQIEIPNYIREGMEWLRER